MRLRDLFSDDATIDPQAEAVDVSRPCRGQPRGEAGRSVLRARRQQDRWRALHRCGDCRRRGGDRGRSSAARRSPRAVRRHAKSAPRAGAGGGEILSAAARDDRGRHRHQRQDLGRGLHAADLAAARPCLRQHRHHRAGVAEAHRLRLADDAGSDRAASPARRDRARRRHPSGASRRHRTGSTSTGSTACASPPAALPICRAITWIIIPTSRTTSPPSCGCSAISWRPAARR